jgi:hypothetical protein
VIAEVLAYVYRLDERVSKRRFSARRQEEQGP